MDTRSASPVSYVTSRRGHSGSALSASSRQNSRYQVRPATIIKAVPLGVAFFFVRRGVEHMKNKLLAPGHGGLNAVNRANLSVDAFTKALHELYDATLYERIPDDMRRLVEKLR